MCRDCRDCFAAYGLPVPALISFVVVLAVRLSALPVSLWWVTSPRLFHIVFRLSTPFTFIMGRILALSGGFFSRVPLAVGLFRSCHGAVVLYQVNLVSVCRHRSRLVGCRCCSLDDVII